MDLIWNKQTNFWIASWSEAGQKTCPLRSSKEKHVKMLICEGVPVYETKEPLIFHMHIQSYILFYGQRKLKETFRGPFSIWREV